MAHATTTKAAAEKAESNAARTAILLAAGVLAVAAFSVAFGLQTLVWINAKQWASANPWLREVPKPLAAPETTAVPTPPSSGTKTSSKTASKTTKSDVVKAYDYEFTSPWPGNVKITPKLLYSEMRFDSGPIVLFFDPEAQLDTVEELKTKNGPEYQQLLSMFGDEPVDNDYLLYKATYEASPDRISPFMNRDEAMRTNGVLLYKLSFGYDLPGDIHSFEFGNNRGFQFGDPVYEQPIAVRVFDSQGKQLRMIFTVAAGSDALVTQDNISSILQSLKTIPLLER
jgi:hypothetical protein